MARNRSPKDIDAILSDERAINRAMNAAFAEAVRRHRQANVPLLVQKGGRPVLVSPFDVRLPGEDAAE
ncbi:MAG TPA: hypothetical protein VF746_08470 [Longimicrobium sp.]